MKATLCIYGFFLSISLWAHKIDQITYKIDLDSTQTMVVHFTQQGAIDLLIRMYPEWKDRTTFNLKKHVLDFEEYFNQNLLLKADGQPVRLEYMDNNLSGHDARITFALFPQIKKASRVTIGITAFLDIYRNPKNFVFLKNDGIVHRSMLDKNTTTDHFGGVNKSNKAGLPWFWILLPIPVLLYWIERSFRIANRKNWVLNSVWSTNK